MAQKKSHPAVKEYKVNQWAGIAKLTLSPNTTPRFYVLAGAGKSTHKMTWTQAPFNWRSPVDKSIPFWTVGLGLEADVWKMIFVGVEGTLTHYIKRN